MFFGKFESIWITRQSFSNFGFNRQSNDESGSFSQLRGNVYRSVVFFDQFPADQLSQAGTLRPLGAERRTEKPLLHLLGHSGAVVTHIESDEIVTVNGGGYSDTMRFSAAAVKATGIDGIGH